MRSAAFKKNTDEAVNRPRRILHDWLRHRIASAGMLHHERREDCVVGRRSCLHPGDDFARGIRKPFEEFFRHRAVRNAMIARPQALADRAQPEIRPAALVGNREAVATDDHRLASNPRKTDAPRTDDDDAAVPAGVGAKASNGCIACKCDRREREVMSSQTLERAAPVETGNAKTGTNRTELCRRQSGSIDGFAISLRDFGKRILEPNARVRRSSFPDAERFAVLGDEPCPRMGASSINSQIEDHTSAFGQGRTKLLATAPPRADQQNTRQQAGAVLGCFTNSSVDQRESALGTERTSPRFAELDLWPTADAVTAMFEGQLAAAAAVQPQLELIAEAAIEAAQRLANPAGRLVYVGAGTSGRLAVLDGSELEPTFSWSRDRLLYGIAGGMNALSSSVENAEDDERAARDFISSAKLDEHDVVIGVSASGTTPFTVAAVREASQAGGLTVAFANNAECPLLRAAKHPILLDTGPEPVSGSTRMKAGTAQKIALNLLSTSIMLRLGRVYGGLMVDVRVSNQKLRRRAIAIVAQISCVGAHEAETALESAHDNVKVATLVAMGASAEEAATLLRASGDNLRKAISSWRQRGASQS